MTDEFRKHMQIIEEAMDMREPHEKDPNYHLEMLDAYLSDADDTVFHLMDLGAISEEVGLDVLEKINNAKKYALETVKANMQ